MCTHNEITVWRHIVALGLKSAKQHPTHRQLPNLSVAVTHQCCLWYCHWLKALHLSHSSYKAAVPKNIRQWSCRLVIFVYLQIVSNPQAWCCPSLAFQLVYRMIVVFCLAISEGPDCSCRSRRMFPPVSAGSETRKRHSGALLRNWRSATGLYPSCREN